MVTSWPDDVISGCRPSRRYEGKGEASRVEVMIQLNLGYVGLVECRDARMGLIYFCCQRV
jgi:hypothetical protein